MRTSSKYLFKQVESVKSVEIDKQKENNGQLKVENKNSSKLEVSQLQTNKKTDDYLMESSNDEELQN